MLYFREKLSSLSTFCTKNSKTMAQEATDEKVSIIDPDKNDRTSLWLLIGGPSKLPKEYTKKAADKVRKKGDGNYVNGIKKDIKMMEDRIKKNDNFELFKRLKNDQKLKKKTVLKNITAICNQAWLTPIPAVIYYTGLYTLYIIYIIYSFCIHIEKDMD